MTFPTASQLLLGVRQVSQGVYETFRYEKIDPRDCGRACAFAEVEQRKGKKFYLPADACGECHHRINMQGRAFCTVMMQLGGHAREIVEG